MRKYAILMVLMAFVIAVTSSCGLIVKDAAVDAQTVIIEVAGQSIVKADVQQAIENVLDYQAYLYGMYGLSFDRTDADTISSAQDTAINALIEEAVLKQKVQEYGLDQFTADELAEIDQNAEDTYAGIVESVKTNYFANTELTGDELNAAIDAKIIELGYSSKESMITQNKLSASEDKLKAMVVKDVAVSETEVQEQYTSGMSNAISTYTTTPTQYATDVSNGEIIYYRPAGYRYIKNLLIMLTSDETKQLQSLRSRISTDQDSLAALEESIAALPEDPANDDETDTKNREELPAQVETLTAEIADLTAQLNTLTDTVYGAIQPTVDEVEAKIAAGEDFDALIAEYGEDPGMTTEPTKSTGYLICAGLTTYIEAFVTESMALKSVGDISGPFRTDYGVHIVQYASDLAEGQVPLGEIRSEISDKLLTTKQNTLYDETVSQWVTEANAKTYPNRLAD